MLIRCRPRVPKVSARTGHQRRKSPFLLQVSVFLGHLRQLRRGPPLPAKRKGLPAEVRAALFKQCGRTAVNWKPLRSTWPRCHTPCRTGGLGLYRQRLPPPPRTHKGSCSLFSEKNFFITIHGPSAVIPATEPASWKMATVVPR